MDDIKKEPESLEDAYRKVKKKKDVEGMAYYKLLMKDRPTASVSWDRFRGSWAYKSWIKKDEVKKTIQDIQDDFKRFAYLNENLKVILKKLIKEVISETFESEEAIYSKKNPSEISTYKKDLLKAKQIADTLKSKGLRVSFERGTEYGKPQPCQIFGIDGEGSEGEPIYFSDDVDDIPQYIQKEYLILQKIAIRMDIADNTHDSDYFK